MSLPGFVEETLELCVDYGATGGPSSSTTVTTSTGGQDVRAAHWPRTKGAWEIGERRLDKADLAYLDGFIRRRRGQAVGFRWRDWADYELDEQRARMIDPTLFQIVKTYGPDDEHAYREDVVKPRPETISLVTSTGVSISVGFDVDSTTGLISLDAPILGDLLVSGEFDKAVRFGADDLAVTFVAFERDYRSGLRPDAGEAFYDLGSLPLIELRADEEPLR